MASSTYTLSAETAHPSENSTILITGGASGIGLATALFLHRAHFNNNVVVLDRAPAPPQGLKELTESYRYLYISCDITDWSSQRDAFTEAVDRFGGLQHVFINAGLAEIGDQIWNDEYDDQGRLKEPNRATIDVDIRAVGDTLKLALHHLRNDWSSKRSGGMRKGSGRGRGGSVVMTASLAGYVASTGAPLYSAAKHGVVGLMRALKGDCAKVGVAISVIAPGITLTPIVMGRGKDQSLEDWGHDMASRGVPINTAETVALAVGHLMGKGMAVNGSGTLIQDNTMQELEGGLARSRRQWMGEEMLAKFPLFPNKL